MRRHPVAAVRGAGLGADVVRRAAALVAREEVGAVEERGHGDVSRRRCDVDAPHAAPAFESDPGLAVVGRARDRPDAPVVAGHESAPRRRRVDDHALGCAADARLASQLPPGVGVEVDEPARVVPHDEVAAVAAPQQAVGVAGGVELRDDGATIGVQHVGVRRVAGDRELARVSRALGAGVEVVLVAGPHPGLAGIVQVAHDHAPVEAHAHDAPPLARQAHDVGGVVGVRAQLVNAPPGLRIDDLHDAAVAPALEARADEQQQAGAALVAHGLDEGRLGEETPRGTRPCARRGA